MADIPAGWHKDANGVMRWWDGSRWTEHTQEGGQGQPAASPGAMPNGSPVSSPGSPGSPGGGNKKAWIIVGAVALVLIVIVGGVATIIGVAVHNTSKGLSAAEKSLDAADRSLSAWANSSDDPLDDSSGSAPEDTGAPADEPSGEVTVAPQPESTFTPDPAKKYPSDGNGGVRSPTIAEARKAPKTADEAKFCQLINALPDSKDEWAAGKLAWERLALGTPADMPPLARQGWEEWMGGYDTYKPGSPEDDAMNHYTFPC